MVIFNMNGTQQQQPFSDTFKAIDQPPSKEDIAESSVSNDDKEKKSGGERDVEEARERRSPGGTTYEWDGEKRAWFPKVDDYLIAQYQLAYGIDKDDAVETEISLAPSGQSAMTDIRSLPKTFEELQALEERRQVEYDEALAERKRRLLGTNDLESESDDESPSAGKRPKRHNATTSGAAKTSNMTESKPADWFDIDSHKNNHIYITGLPTDFTDDELLALTQKCGMVLYDPFTKAPKCKLYRDSSTNAVKGDARCCFIKHESVTLSLQILDGYEVRPGCRINVQQAKFELKGSFDPSKKARRKLTNKERRKLKEKEAKLFEWKPDDIAASVSSGSRNKSERVVVIKHAFAVSDFDNDPTELQGVKDDMWQGAAAHGSVKKVVVHDRNEEGVVMIHFNTVEEADRCVAAMHGRWFAGRRLEAMNWDGKTKYHVEETDEERAARLSQWEKDLEEDDDD